MFCLRIKFALVLLCAIHMISCGFMDISQVGLKIEPNKTDSLLPELYSPVILQFDTAMVKNDAEGILQISSDYGVMNGDKFWKDNDLYFVPLSGWTAGVRYTLSLLGTIRAVDGRDLRLEHFVSFYAVNKNIPPALQWHYPPEGASTGTNNVILEFHFSRSMDRYTVESALVLEGISNKTFEWLEDDQILKVIPEKSLSPWTSYRWNLRDSAKSIDGVPLPKSYSGFFTTDLDQTLPIVTDVHPVQFESGCWYPTGADITTGLRHGQGIAVCFNKPMGENVLRSLRFEPSLSGRTEMLSENSIVYIFTRDPEPETIYTLIVSGDTRDTEGLKIGSDYRTNFTPDIPLLNVVSFSVYDSSVLGNSSDDPITVLNNFSAVNEFPVFVNPATGEIFFSIYFSLPFGVEDKLNNAQKIMLVPFFPRTLSPVALQKVYWISDDRLFMRWEGLNAGDDEGAHYYKLIIPGGRGGITSGAGFYMKEDLIIYLEAVQ